MAEPLPGNAIAPGWKTGALGGRLDVLWLAGTGIGAASGLFMLADCTEGEEVFKSAMTRWSEESASLPSGLDAGTGAATARGAGEEEGCFPLF